MNNEERKGSHGGHGGHGVAEYGTTMSVDVNDLRKMGLLFFILAAT
jgi:hypothetical protein